MADYRDIADDIAGQIARGELRPGTRLLPQREFAYQTGIAASTAGRVYAELRRRGLLVGEVGRGSFVQATGPIPAPPLSEPAAEEIDLELNTPILPAANDRIAAYVASLTAQPATLSETLKSVPAAGHARARSIAAEFLARPDWRPEEDHLLFAANGRAALDAAVAAIGGAGLRIGTDPLTYPVMLSILRHAGIDAVPLHRDAEGITPDAIARAHRDRGLRALYLQPTVHNPLGTTLSAGRRREIADIANRLDLLIVEDAVYSFLKPDAPVPLAGLAPDRVILVESLTKRVAPGLTAGMIVAPDRLRPAIAERLRSRGGGPLGLVFETVLRMIADGAVTELETLKRADAEARQRLARSFLAGLTLQGDPGSFHLWLGLPEGVRSRDIAARAAAVGVRLTPARNFAVEPSRAPDALRLALAAAPVDQMREGLRRVVRLLDPGAGDG